MKSTSSRWSRAAAAIRFSAILTSADRSKATILQWQLLSLRRSVGLQRVCYEWAQLSTRSGSTWTALTSCSLRLWRASASWWELRTRVAWRGSAEQYRLLDRELRKDFDETRTPVQPESEVRCSGSRSVAACNQVTLWNVKKWKKPELLMTTTTLLEGTW